MARTRYRITDSNGTEVYTTRWAVVAEWASRNGRTVYAETTGE